MNKNPHHRWLLKHGMERVRVVNRDKHHPYTEHFYMHKSPSQFHRLPVHSVDLPRLHEHLRNHGYRYKGARRLKRDTYGWTYHTWQKGKHRVEAHSDGDTDASYVEYRHYK